MRTLDSTPTPPPPTPSIYPLKLPSHPQSPGYLPSSPSNPSTSPSPPSPSRHTPVAEDTGSSLPSKLALNFTQQLKHSVLPTEPKFDIREEYIGDPEDSTQSFTSQAGEPYVVIDERTKSDSDTSAESAGSSSGSR